MTRQTLTVVETDFHERMHAAQIHGLWELASQMTRHPEPKAIAHMWKSSLIEAMVRESGEVVPVGEERRALQLFNPGMGGRWATTNTMIAAVHLLLTPSWAWHDHGNETDKPVVWMDGLDIPLVQALNAMFFQLYDQPQVPLSKPRNTSVHLHGHVSRQPTWVKERPRSSPLLLYSWETTFRSLGALRGVAGD